jgi:transposase
VIAPEQWAEMRRLFYAEHFKVGTIAAALGVHPDTVRAALDTAAFNRARIVRASALTDPYLALIGETLERYPRLRATRIFAMLRARGYAGSVVQLRRVIARLRPRKREAFLSLRVFPGEQGQVDWAHFGEVRVSRARRRLSCFVLVLSWSRAITLEFFFDQTLENFLRGHVHAFNALGGVPRDLLYDNLKSAVLERRGSVIHFHPRLLELSAHYHFAARPCRPARGNEKGRVERAIRYVRESFFAGRSFTTLEELNRQARLWRDETAHRRRWVDDDERTVSEVLAEEQRHLLPLPLHPFETDLVRAITAGKTIYVRFDLNDYSIPPRAVGHTLTLIASDTQVRLLDGTSEIARHRRSYGRHEMIVDPAHEDALLEEKRRALGATRGGRLSAAAPEAEALLEAALRRGELAGPQTTQLLRLLDDFGANELRGAIRDALASGTPRATSVAYLLNQRHRARNRRALPTVHLTRRPDLEHLHVKPHDPETYDALARRQREK